MSRVKWHKPALEEPSWHLGVLTVGGPRREASQLRNLALPSRQVFLKHLVPPRANLIEAHLECGSKNLHLIEQTAQEKALGEAIRRPPFGTESSGEIYKSHQESSREHWCDPGPRPLRQLT